jgi:hypothetical protein
MTNGWAGYAELPSDGYHFVLIATASNVSSVLMQPPLCESRSSEYFGRRLRPI